MPFGLHGISPHLPPRSLFNMAAGIFIQLRFIKSIRTYTDFRYKSAGSPSSLI